MTTAALSGAMQPYALTLDRFLEHAARWHGATEVVTGGGGGVTARIGYSALRDRSRWLSGALLSLGLVRGDNLAVMAWNTQAHMECWYAAIGAGIVCHTLNPRLSPTSLAGMIQQAANRVLVVSPDLASLVEKLVPLCPTIEHVVVLDEPGAAASVPNCARVRTWRYGDLLDERGATTSWGGFDENTPAGLCFTSGTTGAPKGVTYTHRSNYLHTLHQLQADMSGLTARDSMLVAVPMFHANGWGLPFAGPAVGAKLVLPGRHQGAEIEAIIGALPEIALVAVIGRPHAKLGERPVLVIEPRKGTHIDDDALFGALRPQVAHWWLPDAVVRVTAMPLATTGKIDKARLRAELA